MKVKLTLRWVCLNIELEGNFKDVIHLAAALLRKTKVLGYGDPSTKWKTMLEGDEKLSEI